jgi:radical SAM superfamily enzyme with C-terminal helix-hairpin-helix motif
MKARYCILDCFVDEPACFGVPPFVSPYPRYVYGALVDAGVHPDSIRYITIDRLRQEDFRLEESYRAVFLIGGAVVPGKYLGAKIGTVSEIRKITENNPRQFFAIGGPVAAAFTDGGQSVQPLRNDIEKFAHNLASGDPMDARRTTEEIGRWSLKGAGVVKLHPSYPALICEIETYRGCPRQQHCSFCSEGLLDSLEFRKAEDIIGEIDALTDQGISRFRLGARPTSCSTEPPIRHSERAFPVPTRPP